MIWKWIVTALFKPLLEAYKTKKQAENDYNRLAAEVTLKQIDRDIEARRGIKEIRLATAGFWEMRVLTAFIAAPFAVHAAAVGLDTTFGFGWAIASYPAPFDEWQGAILLSFFGLQGSVIIARAWAFGRRK